MPIRRVSRQAPANDVFERALEGVGDTKIAVSAHVRWGRPPQTVRPVSRKWNVTPME
jgi:hypothetical protein